MGLDATKFSYSDTNIAATFTLAADGYVQINAAGFTVDEIANVTYNGSEQKIAPVVKDGEKVLVEGTDYTVSYTEDLTNVGTVTVTVTGIGNYTGTKTEEYDI